MRHSLLTLSLLIITVLTAAAQQTNNPNARPFYDNTFVDKGMPAGQTNMIDACRFLPQAPTTADPIFVNDSVQYVRGKELRTTLRGDTAVADASTNIEYIMSRFGHTIGIDLNTTDYPVLTRTLKGVMQDIRTSISKAKKQYSRHRPYQHFNEPTPVPQYESPTDYTSYPSGHSTRGWSVALFLTAVFPEHAEDIIRTGYELGQSRVIVGFHYQSDVDAARLAAAAGFARLCAEKSFRKAIVKCQKEVRRKARRAGK